jgi:hypothetical protein
VIKDAYVHGVSTSKVEGSVSTPGQQADIPRIRPQDLREPR